MAIGNRALITSLWYTLRMSHQVKGDVEPYGLLFQFPLCSGAGVSFTGKAPVPQMPVRLFPLRLCFVHLSLDGLLGALERRLGIHDNPPFAPLGQLQFPAEPVDGSVLRVLPGSAARPTQLRPTLAQGGQPSPWPSTHAGLPRARRLGLGAARCKELAGHRDLSGPGTGEVRG
jgi:hypothetical protein